MSNFKFKNAAFIDVCKSSSKHAPSRKGKIKNERDIFYFSVFATHINVSINIGTQYKAIAKIERDPNQNYAQSKPWNGLMFAYDWESFTGYLYQEVDTSNGLTWVDAEHVDINEAEETEIKQTKTETETTMGQLIKITEQDDKQLVSARELYIGLGYEVSNYARWCKKAICENHFFTDGEDYVTLVIDDERSLSANYNPNQPKDYGLTLTMAKKIAMMAKTEVGDRYRDYFIACEKKLKQVVQQFQVPTTFREALLLAAEQQEKIEQQQLRISEMKPKEEFYDAVGDSKDAVSIGDVAKLLGYKNIGRNSLFSILRIKKVIGNDNLPYQKYINAGYFNIVVSTYNQDGTARTSKTTLVYPKGLDFIRKVVAETVIY
ncbi:MAG: phage antirepressor KilAC domain-containing protein [Bacteroidales bacterium]